MSEMFETPGRAPHFFKCFIFEGFYTFAASLNIITINVLVGTIYPHHHLHYSSHGYYIILSLLGPKGEGCFER